MVALKMILTVLFILVCIALTIIVLLQEGKSAGLGAISGAAETYWGKNKGRSMEGTLDKVTKILVVAFIVIAIVLIPISNQTTSSSETKTTNSTEVSGTTVTPEE